MACDDNISHIARQAAITCLATFGASQLVLRYVTYEQPLGPILQLVVGLLVSCFVVMYFVKKWILPSNNLVHRYNIRYF